METNKAVFLPLPRASLETGNVSKWEVQISFNHPRFPGCYGYFEHDIQGEGGGLWFVKSGDKWELTDFDGRHALPFGVYEALKNDDRFIVSSEFGA